ncbi:MAG: hypothetical protein EA351_03025 [Gemmatimonadales bacterium]|nr:MAG: hypothetical protein EA351_03025 [Gemmatimonadales bacterium]
MLRHTGSMLLSVLTAMILVVPNPAEAQVSAERDLSSGMRTGVGYAASAPDMLLGASVFHLFSDGGFGAVIDFKMGHETIKGDPAYIDEWTTAWVMENRPNDTPLRSGPERNTRHDEWMVVNLGVIRPLTGDFAVILGAGAGNRSAIDEFDTAEVGVTPTQWYYVTNEEASGWELNLHGSAVIKAGQNVLLRFGYDRGPRMISFGGYWALPR